MASNLTGDELTIKWTRNRDNPQQIEFMYSKAPFVCFSGGFGSGKSTALVFRAIVLSINTPVFGDLSGNVGLLGRYKLADFEKTTLQELFRWLPRKWIRKHYRKDCLIELANESLIQYTHFDTIDHIQSFNLGWAGIDQMEEVPWEVFKALAYERIRLRTLRRKDTKGNFLSPAPPLDYQTVFGVCNPKPGWILTEFVNNEMRAASNDPETRAKYNPDYKLIQNTTYENQKFLPKGYIDRQKRDKSERDFARSVLGSWNVFEGQIFPEFTNACINQRNITPHPKWNVCVGLDHGGTGAPQKGNATGITAVVFLALEERQGEWPIVHVYDELYLESSTIEDTVGAIDSKLQAHAMEKHEAYQAESVDMFREQPVWWRCDPSMQRKRDDSAETIMETYMRHASMRGFIMPLAPGSNDVRERIQRISWMLRKGLVKVNPRCRHFIESMRAYEYGKNELPAAFQDDHPVDAFTYGSSAFNLWWNQMEIPEPEPTMRQSAIQNAIKRNLTNNGESDDVYGSRYVAVV